MAGRPKRRRKMRRNRKKFQHHYHGQHQSNPGIGNSGIAFILGALAVYWYKKQQNKPVEVIVLNPEEDLM